MFCLSGVNSTKLSSNKNLKNLIKNNLTELNNLKNYKMDNSQKQPETKLSKLWKLPKKDYKLIGVIGQGSFGTVVKA